MVDIDKLARNKKNQLFEKKRRNFKGENSMHEVVYSPTVHENFVGKKIMSGPRGEIPIFIHGNLTFMHQNVIFMLGNVILPCMKFLCHDFFIHETFCMG